MSTTARHILIFCFLTIIGGMGVLSFAFPPSEMHWHEMRKPNPFPTLNLEDSRTLKAFPHQFDDYFNDRLAFRWQSILARNWAKYSFLATSGTRSVIAGADGTLFLDDDVKQGLPAALPPYSNDEVNAIANYYESESKWMQERGIRYQMVIVPGKAAVYTRKLPSAMRKGWQRQRLSQIVDALRSRGVDVLDLSECLAQSGKNADLYFKFDTHWNDRGALIGAQAIEKALQKDYPHMNRLTTATGSESVHRLIYADLARMLGIHDVVKEKFQKISLKLRPKSKDLPSAVVFCDSFATGLAPFLSHDFKSSVWCREPDPSHRVIDENHPNLVIHEIADRFIALRFPAPVAEKLAQQSTRHVAEKQSARKPTGF